MTALDWASAAAMIAGACFFLAGTIGLFRFPDIYCRLHALTKADNLGVGLVLLGAALEARSLRVALVLLVIWTLVLLASTSACHLAARAALRLGIPPWRRP